MNSHNLSEEDPELLQRLCSISTDFVSLYKDVSEQKSERKRLRELEIEKCRETQKILSRELDDFQFTIDGERTSINGCLLKHKIADVYKHMQEKSAEPLGDNWPAFMAALLLVTMEERLTESHNDNIV